MSHLGLLRVATLTLDSLGFFFMLCVCNAAIDFASTLYKQDETVNPFLSKVQNYDVAQVGCTR